MAVTDTLLRSLREQMLNEDESLAGLLRKCLLLGAETGSESLREWARLELNGYPIESPELPDYRKLSGAPMIMDSMSGNTWASKQPVNPYQMPNKARERLLEFMSFTQPIEEIDGLAQKDIVTFTHPSVAAAQAVWNNELGPYQSVVSLAYAVPGSHFRGIVAQVRNRLVDIVADLTSSTPLTELPKTAVVEAAVRDHVGVTYNTTVVSPSGPVAIGQGANATGIGIDSVVKLLSAIVDAAGQIGDASQKDEMTAAVADLENAVTQTEPDAGEVLKRAGKLRELAGRLGVATVTAATTSAVTAVTELALKGAFG